MPPAILKRLPSISKYGCKSMIFQSKMPYQIKQTTKSAINIVKQIAASHQIVSLSANQIDLEQRFFVCLKDQFIIPGKWKNYYDVKSENQYEAIINPRDVYATNEKILAYEQCPSFEGIKFLIWAPIQLKVTFNAEQDLKKQNTTSIKGFKCRVWDHQIRHLEGVLPIYQRVCKNQFFLLDEYKNSAEFIEYFDKLKEHQRQFTESNMSKMKKEFQKEVKKNKTVASKFQNLQSLRDVKKPDQISEILKHMQYSSIQKPQAPSIKQQKYHQYGPPQPKKKSYGQQQIIDKEIRKNRASKHNRK